MVGENIQGGIALYNNYKYKEVEECLGLTCGISRYFKPVRVYPGSEVRVEPQSTRRSRIIFGLYGLILNGCHLDRSHGLHY